MTDEREEDWSAFDTTTTAGASRGFARAEMVACAACERANPPTRMSCLYCGAPLPETAATEALRRPALRPPEDWERGFNVVVIPPDVAPPSNHLSADGLEEAAVLLRLEPQFLSGVLGAGRALPVARAASPEEASFVARRLSALGLSVEVVSDETLSVGPSQPSRVRRLEFDDETLTAHAQPAARVLAWSELVLIVRGRLLSKRVEVEERGARFGAEKKVADSRELFGDEGVLDLFAEGSHWRLTSDGFDYSALGSRKSLLAGENFETLARLLRERATRAVYDEDYARLRHLLAPAWPPDERTESGGLRRARPGRFNVEAVTHVSNETQFTRYARLVHHLERQRRKGSRA